MRFEQDQDPNPSRDKFKSISSLDEMPERYKKMHAELLEHASSIKEGVQEESGCTEAMAVMNFVAFQGIQIASLQEEVKMIYKTIETVAAEVDNKQDK